MLKFIVYLLFGFYSTYIEVVYLVSKLEDIKLSQYQIKYQPLNNFGYE